jgi:sulfide:quinone oxidoreductase
MKTQHHQIAIIGAGTAGITVAAQLLRKDKKLDIAIIDPADTHWYQPAWTLVAADTYKMKNTARPMSSVIPRGSKWIKDFVDKINADKNELSLRSGDVITYDYLIAAPGIQIDLDGIEGLRETIGKNGVCSNYIDPEYSLEVLKNFKGGNAIFTQAATPIKCGGAPQKIMYLADDFLRKAGIREKTNILYPMPGSILFGVPEFLPALMGVVDRKDISLKFFHKLVKIDGPNKLAYYEITLPEGDSRPTNYHTKDEAMNITKEGNLVVVPFEMLQLAPPQSAPDFIKKSSISYQEGPNKGWIEVDINTLQHPRYPNVFGIGDAAALPTAKTGAAVRKQAPVLVENLLSLMKNEALTEQYEGYSSCPIVTGYGSLVLAEFKYNNVRDSDKLISKFVDTTKESYWMWLLKKFGLPFMYWNLMLKGKA